MTPHREPVCDPDMTQGVTADPFFTRRARVRHISAIGRRVGYLTFGVATGLLVVGLTTTFTEAIATAVLALLIGGSVVLAPAILLHYAVRAADREDPRPGEQ